ncbi:hypothetical protein Dimus_019255 [Dionaea muscipula]
MATAVLGAGSVVSSVPFLPIPVKTVYRHGDILKLHGSGVVGSGRKSLRFNCEYEYGVASINQLRMTYKNPVTHTSRRHSDFLVCAGTALSAKCAAEQTQTVTVERQSIKITNAPVQGKEKTPELDDGGTGFPPRDDGDGGGGGGGGGWGGGFFLFGFLLLLLLFKDKEEESRY